MEEARANENAELVERRQDVKRLEQDLVDAHQVVEAGAAFLASTPGGVGWGGGCFPPSRLQHDI